MRIAMLMMACGLMAVLVRADEQQGTSVAKTATTKPVAKTQASAKTSEPPINSDEPMSIFNEDIRKFKFKMEHERVDFSTALYVTEYLSKYEIPGFIGIYPDALTNSLVFIASPEAEPGIRKALATRIIELQGIDNSLPTPLVTQKKYLKKLRKEQLAKLASLECQLVQHEDDPKVVERYQLLMNQADKELKIIERQIQVVEKYLKQVNNGQE